MSVGDYAMGSDIFSCEFDPLYIGILFCRANTTRDSQTGHPVRHGTGTRWIVDHIETWLVSSPPHSCNNVINRCWV